VASSTASRSRHRFVGLFSRQNKAPLDPLPSSLQFCFSACGSYIALWCVREPRSIVRITQPFRSGRCLPLLPLPNGNSTDNRLVPKSIRHVACSDKTIVAIVHFEHVGLLSLCNTLHLSFHSLDGYIPTQKTTP
jgi:hypothetical protein